MIQVPFSTGKAGPKMSIPDNACDCHHHIYDRSYPYIDTRDLPNASTDDYQLLLKRLGFQRSVIIQPSSYGTDNRCLIDSLSALGKSSRGIAVVNDQVSEQELQYLHEKGVRGLRFNMAVGGTANETMMELLAEKALEFGWHFEIHADGDTLLEIKELLFKLPVQLVFDHFGRIPQPEGEKHPAVKIILELISAGKAWVKGSGVYHDSVEGPPLFGDLTKLAQLYINHNPNRVIWGTDWPHPRLTTRKQPMVDDAELLDFLGKWSDNPEIIHKVLVDNPSELYGF